MRRPSVPGRSSQPVPGTAASGMPEPSAELGDEAETQPIEPFTRSTPTELDEDTELRVALADEAETEFGASDLSEASATGGQQTQVTARDVWRATRARRKAQRTEARRFTARQRRKRWIRIGVLSGVIAVIAAIVAIAYSPLFAVRAVTVSGASDALASSIAAALQPQLGTPLAAVDLDEVRQTVETFSLVESYRVEARPPHELLVRIVQRSPIGALRVDGGFALVDAAGVQLDVVAELPAGLALIEIDPVQSPQAFLAAGSAIRALPESLRPLVTTISGSTGNDTVVSLETGVAVMWGSSDEAALKAAVLERLMAANPQAGSFDVSAPEVPVVR